MRELSLDGPGAGLTPFQPAAHELLAPLRDSGGDLLSTLTAYLDAESSLVDTAATLGAHRNTVADRIARASRLLSVDLADPEARLALHLACRTVEWSIPPRSAGADVDQLQFSWR